MYIMNNGYYFLDRVASMCRVFYDVYIGNHFNTANIIKDEEITDNSKNVNKALIRHYPKEYSLFDYLGPIYKPTLIQDNIYVGSSFNAASLAIMQEFNFKYVINVTTNVPNYFADCGIEYLKIPIKDNNIDKIDKFLNEAYEKILEFQKKGDGNILIHCFVGASRSVSVAMYYMVKKHNMTLDEALAHLKKRRYLIHPSEVLMDSLMKNTAITE